MVDTTNLSPPLRQFSTALCFSMKFTAPKLNVDKEATEELIESSISALAAEIDSYATLSEDEMTYIQALKTEKGFVVQFQCGSIDQHFEFVTYLSRPQTISLFKGFLAKAPGWQDRLRYEKVNLGGFWYTLGRVLGRFIGGFQAGCITARKKT